MKRVKCYGRVKSTAVETQLVRDFFGDDDYKTSLWENLIENGNKEDVSSSEKHRCTSNIYSLHDSTNLFAAPASPCHNDPNFIEFKGKNKKKKVNNKRKQNVKKTVNHKKNPKKQNIAEIIKTPLQLRPSVFSHKLVFENTGSNKRNLHLNETSTILNYDELCSNKENEIFSIIQSPDHTSGSKRKPPDQSSSTRKGSRKLFLKKERRQKSGNNNTMCINTTTGQSPDYSAGSKRHASENISVTKPCLGEFSSNVLLHTPQICRKITEKSKLNKNTLLSPKVSATDCESVTASVLPIKHCSGDNLSPLSSSVSPEILVETSINNSKRNVIVLGTPQNCRKVTEKSISNKSTLLSPKVSVAHCETLTNSLGLQAPVLKQYSDGNLSLLSSSMSPVIFAETSADKSKRNALVLCTPQHCNKVTEESILNKSTLLSPKVSVIVCEPLTESLSFKAPVPPIKQYSDGNLSPHSSSVSPMILVETSDKSNRNLLRASNTNIITSTPCAKKHLIESCKYDCESKSAGKNFLKTNFKEVSAINMVLEKSKQNCSDVLDFRNDYKKQCFSVNTIDAGKDTWSHYYISKLFSNETSLPLYKSQRLDSSHASMKSFSCVPKVCLEGPTQSVENELDNESSKLKLLHLCNQDSILPFSDVFNWSIVTIKKIGEGGYGEVFSITKGKVSTVLKIIPISEVENKNYQTLQSVLSEVKIAQCLTELRNKKNNQSKNFNKLKSVRLVVGQYPTKLIQAWDSFSVSHSTYNYRPDFYNDDQHFVILEQEYGGKDMTTFVLRNAVEAESIFKQIAISLAVAEEEHLFEHRDLHLGNILIKRTCSKKVSYILRGKNISIKSHGLLVSIIDFTLSRLCEAGINGKNVYCTQMYCG